MKIQIEALSRGRLTAWHVRKALRWVKTNDLRGIDKVRILDYEPDDPEATSYLPYLAGFPYNGRYVPQKRSRPGKYNAFYSGFVFSCSVAALAQPRSDHKNRINSRT
jgi:hypothetical protein